ncbi:hypothetical protein HYU19_06130 [Candidatus Woesearchaeota archaeon]|nr:hypothetical protein [Candidatus Woesearchaeota archaeon]
MKIEIIKERETPLLSRTRATLNVEYEGATPSRMALRKEIAKKVGSDEKLTVIRHVYTKFGRQKAKVIVNIYKTENDMMSVEHAKLISKHLGKKEAKEGAAGEAEPAKAAA